MEFFPHSGVTIMVQALWVMNMDLSGVLKAATHFGLGLAMLCAVRIRPLASDLAQEVVTRFGSVTVDSAKILRFNERPLEPVIKGNNSLTLGEPMRIGATDVVLVRDDGGTACPFLYYFVIVSKSGAKATPSFGTCGEITDVKRVGKSISVVMPGYRGPFESQKERREAQQQKHTFIFSAGVVRETEMNH